MKPAKILALFFLFITFSFIFLTIKTNVFGYGEPASAPICNNTAPKMPWPFWAKPAGANSVDLSWGKLDGVSSWTAVYGTKSKVYIYGVHNFGNSDSRSIKIGSLPAGKYYFALRANNGCMPGPFSNEWAVNVGRGGVVNTTQAVSAAKPTPIIAPNTGVRVIPSPVPTKKIVEPKITPKVGGPTIIPRQGGVALTQPVAPKVSFWQRIINFFLGK